jgi:hypothetical protein
MANPDSTKQPQGPKIEIDNESLEYRVAELAFEHGLTAETIAKKLSDEGLAVNFQRVQRAMLRARSKGILVFNPPLLNEQEERQRTLAGMFKQKDGSNPKIQVFNDEIKFDDHDAFYIASAAMMNSCIEHLMELGEGKQEEIIIANAGGPSLAKMVQNLGKTYLRSLNGKRLLFLSLSAVGKPECFDWSPSYLAVRLSEIYSARHYAPEDFAHADSKYQELVSRIDMLVGGIGSGVDGFLCEELRTRKRRVPPDIAGDLFYLPFHSDGTPADTEDVRQLLEELHVHPTFEEFEKLRARKALRMVIVPPPPIESGPKSPPVGHKDPMVRVVLAHGLASHIIIPASMATRIVAN